MLILRKTDKTPDAVELFDLKLIWKGLGQDGDPYHEVARDAFARLMTQLNIKGGATGYRKWGVTA